jgi:HEAT repeat protein
MALFDRFGQNIEKLKEKNDLEGIIRLLAHPDEAVRTGAARELAAMGVPAVAGILKVFEGLDEEERIRYARSLAAPGIPSIPFLLQVIVRASPDARIPLANALSRHGTAVFEVLAAGTGNASHRVRIGSAAALGSMGKEAIGPLRALLTDPEPAVRREAALSLARLGWEPDATPERAYLLFLREEWEDLVRMKNHAVPVLVRGTADPVPETRRNAVRALGKIRHPPTLPTLLGALDDRVLEVRLCAIEAISELRDPRSIPPLIGLLSDEYPQIRMEAAWALDRIGWIPSDDPQRVALCIAKEQWNEVLKLGRCAIPLLIRALQEDHSSVRSGAIETLRKMGKPAHHTLMKAAT